jgi:acylglycerol lipase
MKHEDFELIVSNKKIFGQLWNQETHTHSVIIVHGMGEHSGRYAPYVVNRLLANNAMVIGFDQIGHGMSDGKRGHCPSYNFLLETLEAVIFETKKINPEIPVFLYAQSMGGNIVLNHALRKKPELAGIIASSPFLRLSFQPPAWKLIAGRLLRKIIPSVTLPLDLDTSALSKDKREVEKYEQDPLVHNKVSPNFSFPVMEAGEWAIDNARNLQIPLLIMHGTADRIIDHKGSIAFAENSKITSLRLFKGGYHELHNDEEKEEVLDTAVNWINDQLKK